MRARICSIDLKLFSMRQRFLYSSGTSFMVRFMYQRSTSGIRQTFPSSLTLLFLETLFYHRPKPECCSVIGSHLILRDSTSFAAAKLRDILFDFRCLADCRQESLVTLVQKIHHTHIAKLTIHEKQRFFQSLLLRF